MSLCMIGRYLLTSIFKIYIKFSFFWYITWLDPKISNIFEKYHLSHGLIMGAMGQSRLPPFNPIYKITPLTFLRNLFWNVLFKKLSYFSKPLFRNMFWICSKRCVDVPVADYCTETFCHIFHSHILSMQLWCQTWTFCVYSYMVPNPQYLANKKNIKPEKHKFYFKGKHMKFLKNY